MSDGIILLIVLCIPLAIGFLIGRAGKTPRAEESAPEDMEEVSYSDIIGDGFDELRDQLDDLEDRVAELEGKKS